MTTQATKTRTAGNTGASFAPVVSGLLYRMGYSNEEIQRDLRTMPDAWEMSLMDVCRFALERDGGSVGGFPQEIIARALTTSDFPAILANTANKILEENFRSQTATFQKWASPGRVKDFKLGSINRLSYPSDLPEVGEDDQYTYLVLTEGAETFRLRTYGGLVSFSRQMIINDDLNAFQDSLGALGTTARLTQNRKTCVCLLANPVLSDGVNIFHASRGNLLTGAGSALGDDSLASAVKAFRLMTDSSGNQLGIEPKILLVPPSLENLAHQLCFSISLPGQNNANVLNFFQKLGIEPVVEPLLENSSIPGYSSTAWYLLPEPKVSPVRYFTLDGSLAPHLGQQEKFASDGIEYKVRIDFGAAAIGYRGVKSDGQ